MSNCINCGKHTNELFCEQCKNKIQKEIEKPKFEHFHKKYDNQKIWKCENGICVKSQGERTIADFLYTNHIPFQYEIECRYGEYNPITKTTTARYLVPDFYIKGPVLFNGIILENIYIEFWGKSDKEYLEKKKYRTSIYEAHKATLINVYLSDLQDYKKTLTYKLTHFANNLNNY